MHAHARSQVQATEDAQASCLPAWHHPQRSPFSPSASPTQQQQHQTAAPLRPSATELLVMPGLGPIGSAPTNMLATGSLESVAPDVPSKQPFSRSMSAIDLQPSSMAGGERMRAGRGSKVATSYDFEGKVHGGVYKSASYRSSSALLEEWGGPSSAGSLADGSGQAWAAWGPQGLPLVSGSCASSHGSSLNQLPPPLATQSSDKLGTPSPSKQAARSEQGPHTPCGASAAGSAMDAGEDPQQPRTGCATLQGGCQGGVAAQPSQDACQEVGRVADCRAVPACEAAQGSSQGAPAACKVGASTQGAQAQAAAAAEEEEKEREEQRLQALLLGSAASSYSSSSGGGRACSLEGVHGTLLMAVAEEEGEAAGGMCASDTHVVGSSSAQEQQQQQQQQQQHEGQLQPLQSSASCPAHAKLNRNSSSSKSRHSCGLPLGEASWARDVFAGAITYSSCGSGLSLLEFADGSSSRSLGAWANKSLPQVCLLCCAAWMCLMACHLLGSPVPTHPDVIAARGPALARIAWSMLSSALTASRRVAQLCMVHTDLCRHAVARMLAIAHTRKRTPRRTITCKHRRTRMPACACPS